MIRFFTLYYCLSIRLLFGRSSVKEFDTNNYYTLWFAAIHFILILSSIQWLGNSTPDVKGAAIIPAFYNYLFFYGFAALLLYSFIHLQLLWSGRIHRINALFLAMTGIYCIPALIIFFLSLILPGIYVVSLVVKLLIYVTMVNVVAETMDKRFEEVLFRVLGSGILFILMTNIVYYQLIISH